MMPGTGFPISTPFAAAPPRQTPGSIVLVRGTTTACFVTCVLRQWIHPRRSKGLDAEPRPAARDELVHERGRCASETRIANGAESAANRHAYRAQLTGAGPHAYGMIRGWAPSYIRQ